MICLRFFLSFDVHKWFFDFRKKTFPCTLSVFINFFSVFISLLLIFFEKLLVSLAFRKSNVLVQIFPSVKFIPFFCSHFQCIHCILNFGREVKKPSDIILPSSFLFSVFNIIYLYQIKQFQLYLYLFVWFNSYY